MEKTISSLLDAVPLSDGDFLPVNQPDVFNPITQQNGDTRRVTIKQLADYAATRINTELMPLPYLVAINRQQLQIKNGTILKITVNGTDRFFEADEDITLNISNILDIGAIAPGKDYYLFLAPNNDTVKFVISLNKIAPDGFTAGVVKLIGGFHSLCASVGNGLTYEEGGVSKSHPLNGFLAGDILPASVWCLNHRPHSEPEGMVYISSLDFWCDIYLQSGSGANTKSAYQATPTRTRQYVNHVEDMFCVKKELLDDAEFAAAMLGSNEQTSIAGSAFPSNGAGGHNDTAGRRMISIYGVEEGCGFLWQWLRTTSAAGVEGTFYGQTATTPSYGAITITQSSYGPYGQAGAKGSFWGLVGALLAGGDWSDGSHCGSRSRDAYGARSYAYSKRGGRGRSRCINAAKTI